jgi:hypothetical protein
MEAAYSSETLVYNQKTTKLNNPEDHYAKALFIYEIRPSQYTIILYVMNEVLAAP